jgi:hypothetical protein
MENKQFENKNFILFSPDSLKYITDNMENILNLSLEFYKKIFDIESYRRIQINYFDDKDKFRNFIYDIRGEKESLPKYAVGTFDKGMINAYIKPNIIVYSNMYYKTLHMASHELFHIMYRELILEKESLKRITWFDEGMAQFFSGEYDFLLKNEEFENWFNYVLQKTLEVPNLNELDHGKNFETDKYSGYKLSLLAVKYLYEILGFEEFKKLMHDNKRIIEYGNTVARDAIKYYKNKMQDDLKEKSSIIK